MHDGSEGRVVPQIHSGPNTSPTKHGIGGASDLAGREHPGNTPSASAFIGFGGFRSPAA